MPNCLPSLKNMSLFSHSSRFLLCSPFPTGDFHFFNPIFFTQKRLCKPSQPPAKSGQVVLCKWPPAQEYLLYKHDLVTQKLTSEKLADPWAAFATWHQCQGNTQGRRSWSEITHLYIDRIPGLSSFFSGVWSMLLLFPPSQHKHGLRPVPVLFKVILTKLLPISSEVMLYSTIYNQALWQTVIFFPSDSQNKINFVNINCNLIKQSFQQSFETKQCLVELNLPKKEWLSVPVES